MMQTWAHNRELDLKLEAKEQQSYLKSHSGHLGGIQKLLGSFEISVASKSFRGFQKGIKGKKFPKKLEIEKILERSEILLKVTMWISQIRGKIPFSSDRMFFLNSRIVVCRKSWKPTSNFVNFQRWSTHFWKPEV